MSFKTDAARWRALSTRDSTANNHFVYTVKSTRIYCRPTCPARVARRANIGFCNTPAEAEAAGYRACKRCKPNAEIVEDPQEQAVAKACALIQETVQRGQSQEGMRLQDLAKSVGFTPRYFHKIFKDKMGITPKEYAKSKQEESGSESSVTPQDRTMELEPFNLNDFDFSDLIDLSMVAAPNSLSTRSWSYMEPLPGMFDNEIDTNLPVPASDALDPTIINTWMVGDNGDLDWLDMGLQNSNLTLGLDAALGSELFAECNQDGDKCV